MTRRWRRYGRKKGRKLRDLVSAQWTAALVGKCHARSKEDSRQVIKDGQCVSRSDCVLRASSFPMRKQWEETVIDIYRADEFLRCKAPSRAVAGSGKKKGTFFSKMPDGV